MNRDTEPSRIPVKRLFQNMRKRQIRQKYKKVILKSIPMSSKIYDLLKKLEAMVCELIGNTEKRLFVYLIF